MTDIEQYIQSYFGIAREDVSMIAGMFEPAFIKKGDYFVKQGAYCDKLSFIRSGFLRVYATVEDKEVTQWIAAKGSFMTELASLTNHTPSRWSIQALVDTELYTIHKDDYNKLPSLVSTWHELEKQFIINCFTFMENRIFAHLSMNAEQRFAFFYEKNSELFNRVPLQYIASMLGMTPETFSRIRKQRSLIS